MKIVKSTYLVSKLLPEEEKFNLRSQIQKSAVSIPSNVAEGCSRESDLAFKRFLEIAIGSSFELETQLVLCQELGLIKENQVSELLINLNILQAKMNALRNKLKT